MTRYSDGGVPGCDYSPDTRNELRVYDDRRRQREIDEAWRREVETIRLRKIVREELLKNRESKTDNKIHQPNSKDPWERHRKAGYSEFQIEGMKRTRANMLKKVIKVGGKVSIAGSVIGEVYPVGARIKKILEDELEVETLLDRTKHRISINKVIGEW